MNNTRLIYSRPSYFFLFLRFSPVSFFSHSRDVSSRPITTFHERQRTKKEKEAATLPSFHRSAVCASFKLNFVLCLAQLLSRALAGASSVLVHPRCAYTGPHRGWSGSARARIATRDFAYVAANAAKNFPPPSQTRWPVSVPH